MELTRRPIDAGSESRLFSLRIGRQALGEADGGIKVTVAGNFRFCIAKA